MSEERMSVKKVYHHLFCCYIYGNGIPLDQPKKLWQVRYYFSRSIQRLSPAYEWFSLAFFLPDHSSAFSLLFSMLPTNKISWLNFLIWIQYNVDLTKISSTKFFSVITFTILKPHCSTVYSFHSVHYWNLE